MINRRLTLVWAAGNSGTLCSSLSNAIWGVASAPHSISAGALDERGSPQPYSSHGEGQCSPGHPTVSAPTWGILPWGDGFRNLRAQGGGTSAAAALVAGSVALALSLSPDMPAETIARILRDTAQDLPDPKRQTGGGLLRISHALGKI